MRVNGILALLCFAALAQAQDSPPKIEAPYVTCGGATHTLTPLVTSPDARVRAQADIIPSRHGNSDCENTLRLLIGESGGEFKQVAELKPPQVSDAAGLAAVAWSRDDRFLAAELGNWINGSDAFDLQLLIYDRLHGVIDRPNVPRIVTRKLSKGCSVWLRSVEGFDSQGRVIVLLSDQIDEENQPQSHCMNGNERWLYDPVQRGVQPQK